MPLSGALCIGGVPLTGVPGSADTWPNGVVGVSGSWSSSDSSAPLPKSDSSSNSSSSSPAPSTLPTMFTEMGGGGGGVVTLLSTKLELGRCTGQSTAQGTTDYSDSESSSLLPLSTRAGTPFGHTSPCL